MKKLLIVLPLVSIFFIGCHKRPQPVWVYSSDDGRKCFNKCQREYYNCHASCYGGQIYCNRVCGKSENLCLEDCPDLRKELR